MTDLRVVKTRKAIQDAFVDLVLEEGFDRITVSELARRAMINRQTFYKHYLDKFDLAEQMGHEIVGWYDQLGEQRVNLSNQDKNIIQIMDELRPTLTQLIQTNSREISAMRLVHLPNFDLWEEITKRIEKIANQLMGGTATLFEQTIMTGIVSGLINYLISQSSIPDDEELAESLVHIKALFR